jgi:hypothetical protein
VPWSRKSTMFPIKMNEIETNLLPLSLGVMRRIADDEERLSEHGHGCNGLMSRDVT